MKRGIPLRRRTGLKVHHRGLSRTTSIKPKREAPRKSERVLNEDYLERVRKLPCYVCGWNRVDADHQGEHPYGRKASDDTAVPMCRDCHRSRTDGYVFSWSNDRWERADKQRMREWCDNAIMATRAKLKYG